LADKDNSEAARERLRKFAGFIVNDKGKVWASEPVFAEARYQLALLAIRDGNVPAAVEQLEEVPADYPGYVFSQCQLALLDLKAARDPNLSKTDADRAAWEARALQALRRVPNLPAGADPATAQMFFFAQLDQGKMLFEEGQALARKGDLK